MNQIQYEFKSQIRSLYLVASSRGLEGIYFNQRNLPIVTTLSNATPEGVILIKTVRQLEEYFAGKRQEFDIPLHFSGTPFQEKVWRALAQIPFGTTVSYKDIAKRINNPKAVRAVGTANGKNPICIIIPCHRVIAADGTMGGYGGGLPTKKQLLDLEFPK